MKPIIVSTDFSPAALNAVNYAADMALALDATLIILHVYQIPVSMPLSGGMGGMDTPTMLIPAEELEESAENRLQELKKNLHHISFSKLVIETEARLGDVADEIGETCKKFDPFVVVMGSTGHSAMERVLFGSTTQSVIRELQWPLLLVPKGTEYGKGIRKAGLAWDFTKTGGPIPSTEIVSIIKTLKASLHVVHVELDMSQTTQSVVDNTLQDSLSPVTPSYHHVQDVALGDGISNFAEKNNFDLLITLPRKHSFLESIFSKTATKELIQGSHIPVLCIHAD